MPFGPTYPDPLDREAFETHAINVRPEDMTLDAIGSELASLDEWTTGHLRKQHRSIDWRTVRPLLFGGATLVAGAYSLAEPVLGVPATIASGGAFVADVKRLWDEQKKNRRMRAAIGRVVRRREALEARRKKILADLNKD